MRISAITNLAYGVTLLLTGVSGIAFLASIDAAAEERLALERHIALNDGSDKLALGAEKQSDEARLFAMRGQERHIVAFQREEAEIRSREQAIGELANMGMTPDEQAALAEVERNIAELDRIERMAIASARGGDQAGAQALLFGPDHERAQNAVLEPVKRFQALVNARTDKELAAAQDRSDLAAAIVRILLALTALVFLAVLYFVLRRRVALPLVTMSGVVTRLARQDYEVEVPFDRRRDEIGDMSQAIEVFRTNGMERERLDAERLADQRIKDVILQMMHRLQACATQEELAEVVTTFAPQIFPGHAGHLYVLNEGRTGVSQAGTWLEPVNAATSFSPNACWGLRRGRPHGSNIEHTDIACLHVGDAPGQPAALCVPLTAQGDTMGLLYFESPGGATTANETQRLYLELVAENLGLALANLRLRERLTRLAVRDALTGLLNRRCLDETMARCAREPATEPIACLMIDIDHFKRFNDEFGHDAGDSVMQHVAQMMSDYVDGTGSAYRFGGEEFTVLLPGKDEAQAADIAEELRIMIGHAPLSHRGRILGTVSVSIGAACSPEGGSFNTLLNRADAALLAAKAEGRNQVIAASRLANREVRSSAA